MASLRPVLFAVCCLALHAPPAGATVAIEGAEPRERIVVTIRDASTDAALRELARTYGFDVKGALVGGDDPMSTVISGTLADVLARLLRNMNHVIVRSPDNRSGVEAVIVSAGAAPQPTGEAQPQAGQPAPPPLDED